MFLLKQADMYLSGMSYRQIAKVVGQSYVTVRDNLTVKIRYIAPNKYMEVMEKIEENKEKSIEDASVRERVLEAYRLLTTENKTVIEIADILGTTEFTIYRDLTNRLNEINERTSKYESEKEKLEESIKDDMTNLLSIIDKSDSQIYHTYSSYTKADQDVQYYKKLCKKALLKLFTSLISTAITLSISIGIFSGVFSWFKKLTSAYYYDTNTEIYNSITNQVTSSNAKEIIGVVDETKPEQTYLIEYHVLDDKTAKKEGRASREYNYGAAEAKLKLRETKTYDLSFLGYDDIEKYIEYIQSNNLLPESKKNIIDISKSPIKYTELVDYYEIIYKTIDLESKEFESTKTTINVAMGLLVSGLFILIFHRLAKIDLSYFKDKKFLKRDKKELLEYAKILLNEIGKNEELRQQFNIEMSKHKDIFIKYGLELPKEVVDSNIKKKLM